MKYDFGDTPNLFVDVDGTLLYWPGYNPGKGLSALNPEQWDYSGTPTLNHELIAAIKTWHVPPKHLVIWSWGGAEHAQRAAVLCGLKPDACVGKPWTYVDDMTNPQIFLSRAKHSRHVHAPTHLP